MPDGPAYRDSITRWTGPIECDAALEHRQSRDSAVAGAKEAEWRFQLSTPGHRGTLWRAWPFREGCEG